VRRSKRQVETENGSEGVKEFASQVFYQKQKARDEAEPPTCTK
jgi:hypothetical protein